MDYPLVSCIVLTYNTFKYLYETIDSILSQDYSNIEIIVGDDGSKEFPEEQICRYISKYKKSNVVNVIIYSNTTNLGTVKNINNAHTLANGKYLVNLSCNDVFFDESILSKVVERFEKTGYSLIAFRRMLCDEKTLQPIRYIPSNAVLTNIKALDSPEKQYLAFAQCNYYEMASGSCTYQTKENLSLNGYWDESYKLWEDGPFYIKYTRNGNMIHTAYDIVVIKYRVGGISTSNNVPIKLKTLMSNDIKHYYCKEVEPYLFRFGFYERRKIDYFRICAFNSHSKWLSLIKRLKYLDLLFINYFKKKKNNKDDFTRVQDRKMK